MVWRDDGDRQESRLVSAFTADDQDYDFVIALPPWTPPPAPVPQSISARQMRLFLLNQNLLQQVEAMIANCPPAMQIEWQYSTQFLRDSPVMIAAAEAMNITPQTLDQWFITAAEL